MDDKVLSYMMKFKFNGVDFFIKRKFWDSRVYFFFEEEDGCVVILC